MKNKKKQKNNQQWEEKKIEILEEKSLANFSVWVGWPEIIGCQGQ